MAGVLEVPPIHLRWLAAAHPPCHRQFSILKLLDEVPHILSRVQVHSIQWPRQLARRALLKQDGNSMRCMDRASVLSKEVAAVLEMAIKDIRHHVVCEDVVVTRYLEEVL